ncbi:hypothetical protein BGZ65_006820 [Modicella reniformis]|uniref:Uncharacterized protein n=1 Tax=Modicella reniformis TaxID=1440133 RepID=A0A9P6IK32_9FUNG|nr:hypothetical protein BGZ65_006820 [Modicella reniformis]
MARTFSPLYSKVKDKRMAIWQDIIKSMFHHIWAIRWGIDRSEPDLLNPFPHQPQENYHNIYQRIYCRKTLTSQTQKDPMATLVPGRWSKRTVTASADKGHADLITEKIEVAQRQVSDAMNEIKVDAHMTTLVVASVSKTVQDFIEANTVRGHSLQEDCFKLLGDEFLKAFHTRFMSDSSSSEATSTTSHATQDRHPIWTAIFDMIEGSKYEFIKSRSGMSQTIQQHIQQAAYLVLNSLRLQLAPRRFVRYEEIRKKKAEVESSKAS